MARNRPREGSWLIGKARAALMVLPGIVALASSLRAEPLDEVLESRQSPAEKQLEVATQATLNAASAAAAALPRQYPAAVRHLRFSEGPRFADVPRAETIKATIEKVASQRAEKTFRELTEEAKKQQEKWSRPEDLPTCSASREEKFDLQSAKAVGEEMVVQDMLFLGSDPPLDFETRYGESVEVQRLNGGADPLTRGFAQGARITCVPARFRLTNRALYRLEGEAALRRFEDKRFDARKKKGAEVTEDDGQKRLP